MKKIYLLSIILAATIFQSCDDMFTQVVEFDLPEHESRLVSYCFIDINNPEIKVDISKSLGVLEEEESTIDEANISMLKGDQMFIDEFQHDSIFIRIDYSNPYKIDSIYRHVFSANSTEAFEGNDIYRLEVSSAGFEDVYAEAKIPTKVPLSMIKFEKDGFVDNEGNKSDEIEIEFTDPGDEDNYYIITATHISENAFGSDSMPVYLDVHDPRIEHSYYLSVLPNINSSFLFFEDKDGFNGSNNTIKLSGYFHDSGGDSQLNVRLYSISEDLFKFIKSYSLYQKNGNNLFSEPVSIHNNVINGFGLFGLYDYDEMTIDINL